MRLTPQPRLSCHWLTALCLALLFHCSCTTNAAQQPTVNNDLQPISDSAVRYADPVETIWEFGLKISSTHNAKNVQASLPIPMDWPEQKIVLLETDRSGNLDSFEENNPTDESRQITFGLNHMRGGSQAHAIMRFRVTRQMILKPTDTSKLKFATKHSSRLKAFLKPSPQIESKDKHIKQIGADLKDDSLSDWEQVETIYRWVRDNIEYKFDTQIHSCLEALESKHGDCEELSSLFIAICRSQKIPARAVWIPGHTYPEFYLEDEDGNGHWFPCQAAGEYEFGAMTESRPVLQKGDRFRLPRQRETLRYLQPTLSAQDTLGQLSIDEWIAQEVSNSGNSKPGSDEVGNGRPNNEGPN